MRIYTPDAATEELHRAIGRLVPQLNPTAAPPTLEELSALIQCPSTELWVAADPGEPGSGVGMLTLAWYPIPTGVRVWIEDVVVDAGARGRGVGEALVRVALDRARALGARSVDLTSRPDREAANRLYRRLGFQLRETNAYRFRLHP